MTSIDVMPGSKQHSFIQFKPWEENLNTAGEMSAMPRASLPPGYPADLARNSQPDTGSIGVKGMPQRNRKAPFVLKGGR